MPVVILVETGPPPSLAASPSPDPGRSTDAGRSPEGAAALSAAGSALAPAAAAVAPPAGGSASVAPAGSATAQPEVSAAAGRADAVKDIVLRILLGRDEKFLRCRQEDVTGFVGMAYLAGGFPMVIAARRAIEAGIKGLADDHRSRQGSLAALERMAAGTGKPLSSGSAAAALPDARTTVERSRAKLMLAEASHASFGEYFRLAWTAIAAHEEQLVRRYDRELAIALKHVAATNKDLAAREWAKYAPTIADGDQKPTFETAKADAIAGLALSRSLVDKLAAPEPAEKPADAKKPADAPAAGEGTAPASDPARASDAPPADVDPTAEPAEGAAVTDEERTEAIKALWRIALKLHDRAEDVRVNRRIAPAMAQKDTPEQTALKAEGLKDIVTAWSKARTRAAKDYPVLLQIYPSIGSTDEANSLLKRFPTAVAEALLRTRDECARITKETIQVWDKPTNVRLVPVADSAVDGAFVIPEAQLNRSIGTRTAAQKSWGEVEMVERNIPLRTVLDGEHLKVATTFGLTIPASEVYAGLLKWDANRRRNSGWLHAPAGFELLRRARTDADLGPYFEAGTIAHAAVSRVLDSLAAMREREKTWESRGMLLMWGAAALLAPFTEGTTLYGASLVQASVSAHEIYQSVTEYQNDSALSAVSLTAIEEASWRRPSTVNLVRTIVADTADVVQGTIGARGLPVVLDLALGALSIIHPDQPDQPATARPR